MSQTMEGGAMRGRRLAAIFGGFALCVGAVVVCLQDSGAGDGPSVLERWSFREKAPTIQLAERRTSTSVFGASKSVELDSVVPMLTGHGTKNLAAVSKALLGTQSVKQGGGKAAFITLPDVPTEITITAPEDVTIPLGSDDGDKMAVFKKYFNKTQAHLFEKWGYGRYEQPGVLPPTMWGFKEKWSTCRSGKEQSPINLRGGVKGTGMDPLLWMCGSEVCDTFNSSLSESMQFYDGHAISVDNFAGDGNPTLSVGAEIYSLESIQLHTPSEHTLDGTHYDLEVQMKHRSTSGKLMFLSALFQAGAGNESPLWIQALSAVVKPCLLSTDSTECLVGERPAHLAKAFSFREVASSIKAEHYYRYSGSLTSPPCSEHVEWNVIRRPLELNQEDWTLFAAFQGKNNRPVQPMNGRTLSWV